jgi:hypothetical protein
MAEKGYGADPTLVSAAFRLGQSYIPKDYSSIFAKQYEGMIAGYKAKYEAMGEGIKSIGEVTGKIMRRDADIKDKWAEETHELDQGLGFDDELNEMATTYNAAVQKEQKTAYDNNDQLPNKAVFDAEKEEFEKIKDQIEKLNKKGVFLGKKGKQERVDLIRSALKLREHINTTRGNDAAYNEAVNGLLVDQTLTHKNNPDLQFLLAEKTKKDSDLRDIGVTVFFKDGKKHYKYPVGLGANIYNKIQKDKGVEDSLLIPPPKDQEYLTVSEEQLYEGVVYKDNASRNTIRDGHVKEVTDAASELNATKNLAVKNYSDIKIRTKENIEATLEGSSSYQNLTNEGILIGNTKVNWSKELNAGLAIDEIIVNQEGLGSDILTMADLDGDGIIDETEWEKLKGEKGKHSEARAQIIDKLLNPQTPQEKELSIDAYSEFISDKAEQVFNYTREQMGYVYNEENKTWTMPDAKDPWWKQLGYTNIGQAEEYLKKKDGGGGKFGYNADTRYFTMGKDQGHARIYGRDIVNAVETFKSVQDKGSGIFTGYDKVPHKLIDGKWFTYDDETKDFTKEDNAKSIFTALSWDNNPKIMEYLKSAGKVDNKNSVMELGLGSGGGTLAKPPNVSQEKWGSLSELEQMNWYLENGNK